MTSSGFSLFSSYDLSVPDPALADTVYSPEDVALLDRALECVCATAEIGTTITPGLRSLLASAVLEGAMLGYREHDSLASFALRTLPLFRNDKALPLTQP